ncbi:unnamed protein product [Caenorhabditis brenneri]
MKTVCEAWIITCFDHVSDSSRIPVNEKYQEADNIITFNHVLDFKIGIKEVRAKALFSTVFENTILDWDMQLHKQFAGRFQLPSESWVINLIGTGSRDMYPPVHRIDFKINALDSHRNITKSLKYFIDGQHVQPTGNPFGSRRGRIDYKSYNTQQNCPFEKALSELVTAAKKKEITLQMETRMEFKRTDFSDMKFLIGEGAPNVPEKLDYFFDAITNRNRHDLKLKTSDGNHFLMTNKEIICLASSFFRQTLKEETIEYTVGRAESVDAIDICLTYLVTGRYKKPSQLTPRLALEIFTLAVQWKVFELRVLKNSLERHCCEELFKNREDLIYVVTLLIAAEDGKFENVLNCCIATINYFHFHDFIRTFVNGSHPLKDRIMERRDFARSSLAMQVKRAFAASRETKSFIKFLPVLGED